jgi:2-methylcitrate dehydratase
VSDRITRLLAGYASGVVAEDLPEQTTHEVQRRILDSIGVAVAGLDGDAPAAARAYAEDLPDPNGATIWGSQLRANPEVTGFANGVAVRYLDFNDTYLSREPLHPSDVIAPLMALAEWHDRPANDLLAAIATAYEVSVTLCDAASLRTHGWDHVNYIGIGVACAAGQLLRLPVEGIEHAVSIAAVPHAAMRETRAGELSMWKGAAAANAARNAVFATLLSEKGMTGAARPFEGEMAFVRQLLDGEGFNPHQVLAGRVPRAERRRCRPPVPRGLPPGRRQDQVDRDRDLRCRLPDHRQGPGEVGPEDPRDGRPLAPVHRGGSAPGRRGHKPDVRAG